MESFSASVESLLWATAAMFVAIFVFAMLFLQGASEYLYGNDPNYTEEVAVEVRSNFGSLYLTMLSLYKSGTGGADWEGYYGLMQEMGPGYAVVFLGFVQFFGLVVMNVITGIMVDKVVKAALEDRERCALKWRDEKTREYEAFENTINNIDCDQSGTITWQEFDQVLADENAILASQLASLGLDIKSARVFFKCLQVSACTEDVPIDLFVQGCIRMAGAASSVDLHLLSVQVRTIHEQQMKFMRRMEGEIKTAAAAANGQAQEDIGDSPTFSSLYPSLRQSQAVSGRL